MERAETKVKEQYQFAVTVNEKEYLPTTTMKEPIAEFEEEIIEEKDLILRGKSPLRLSPIFKFSKKKDDEQFDSSIMQDEVDWKEPVLRKHYSTFNDALEKVTATTDFEIAEEVFFRGINAMPNQKNNKVCIANTMFQTLADREPKDSTEAKLIMQEAALYAQGMEYLKRAESADRIHQADFYMKNAIKLLRLHNETIETLNKYRRGGEQKVTVQHQYVQVNDGGKAVIGQLGGGGKEKIGEVIP